MRMSYFWASIGVSAKILGLGLFVDVSIRQKISLPSYVRAVKRKYLGVKPLVVLSECDSEEMDKRWATASLRPGTKEDERRAVFDRSLILTTLTRVSKGGAGYRQG